MNLLVENPMVRGRIHYPTVPYEPVVSFEMHDDFGSFIASRDVYFEIGDAIVHIDNVSDYLSAGYKDDSTYDMSDSEVIAYVELHYGFAHTKK
ncbi:hypothetical protein [Lysinibacillus sphaericus]|uniref:Uncharacterized protein n=2 Tax=Lysinibacillus sphaericus TaxID=1421 RepID=A0A2S0K6F2_LYSSH|nr:hypothetical protein [Lysinibacillus sphaericus]AVK98879.1 hypothetical protein LS41612_22595 [Lysinibacillus sphaericus]MED4545258.1 hypothetical protein [Lysinibacillus sphaericus]GEC82237.1 hypothetical protein LSP03_19800 [Lysinibacillus sphaericus]SUV15102.1 Uncharacterised protein [Lysinibacillus sphaericus]